MNSLMPVYEYEPVDRDCFMCPNRVAAIQSVNDEALKFCPDCGLEVKRVISRASFKVSKQRDPGKHGFTVWKRAEKGVWEKAPATELITWSGTKKRWRRLKPKRPDLRK